MTGHRLLETLELAAADQRHAVAKANSRLVLAHLAATAKKRIATAVTKKTGLKTMQAHLSGNQNLISFWNKKTARCNESDFLESSRQCGCKICRSERLNSLHSSSHTHTIHKPS